MLVFFLKDTTGKKRDATKNVKKVLKNTFFFSIDRNYLQILGHQV